VTFSIPLDTLQYGFVLGGLGAHSSRTIMLHELTLLLAACPPSGLSANYAAAVVEENVLLKRTESTRRKSLRYLRELYGLDTRLVLWRALRDLWEPEQRAQPTLALLCALARDPSLRATATLVLQAERGAELTSEDFATSMNLTKERSLNPATIAKIGRNAASSWTQSSHLQGRTHKVRVKAQSHPTSVAYALLLGYLCGSRGEALFSTGWAQLLDAPPHTLHEQAFLAAQRGWLEYRHAGTVTEIGFSHLLRKDPIQNE